MKKLLIIFSVVAVLCTSCNKTCRCYRYDGNVDEFDEQELEELGTSCQAKEEINFHLTYSLCEKVLF
ncbi:MAG: hypothetical protein II661_07525 [Bacteroidales bacterium]|jgi:hypothetical protein|nr:hypothetical protein [Bacteroidales bacterium]MBR4714602.1 hypothetical protein [Bacteroidales bacterium]MCR4931871.1 hypothetical protein [Bacteroidales bacterium]